MKYGSSRRVRPKITNLAPLDGYACAFEEWFYGGRKVPKSHELALMIICILLLFFQPYLPCNSINGLRRAENSFEISLKGHNSSLSNTLVLLKLTHSFLSLPLLWGSPDFNKFGGIFASLVDVLIWIMTNSFDNNQFITILNLCKETGSVYDNWLFCVESRPWLVLEDVVLYALTFHWTYCHLKRCFDDFQSIKFKLFLRNLDSVHQRIPL